MFIGYRSRVECSVARLSKVLFNVFCHFIQAHHHVVSYSRPQALTFHIARYSYSTIHCCVLCAVEKTQCFAGISQLLVLGLLRVTLSPLQYHTPISHGRLAGSVKFYYSLLFYERFKWWW